MLKKSLRTTFVAATILVAGGHSASAVVPADWLGKVDSTLVTSVTQGGQAEFLIAMGSSADLAMAQAAKTREARGSITYQILKAHAAKTQESLLADLALRGVKHRSFWVANAVSATGTLADIQLIAQRPDVAHIYAVTPSKPYVPGGIEQTENVDAVTATTAVEVGNVRVKAPEVWALGFTGQGVVVGDHDIGVEWTHPALKTHYRGWNPATQTATHNYNWRNAFEVDSYCDDPSIPCDPNSHGTHTTGTMVGEEIKANGDREQIGMAPSAQWIACRSLYDDVAGAGTVPTYMDCMEWMIAPYPINTPAMADPSKAPDVVNNSWGCLEACAPPLLKDVNDATKAAGIVQVVSAGNDGSQCSTIIAPLAVYESSFTVGASNTVNDGMASFSSRGPVLVDGSMRTKPDIVAPGVATRSSVPGDGYGNKSGTSMAGPHVAGMVALIMSAEPRLKGRVDDVRNLITRTAVASVDSTQTCGGIAPTTLPNNVFGHGRIDALAAVLARPMLAASVAAPDSVLQGEDFDAVITVTQPATGKLNVTAAQLTVALPPEVSVVSSSPAATSTSNAAGPKLTFLRGSALAPGQSWAITLRLGRASAGEVTITPELEADQVSPTTEAGRIVAVTSPVMLPDPFLFTERSGVAVSTMITSEAVTLKGFGSSLPIKVSAGGQYRINGGNFTSDAGTIRAGDVVAVRHVSAAQVQQAVETTLTVGDYSTVFRSVTAALDTVPDAFNFGTKFNQVAGAYAVSEPLILSGYNADISLATGPGLEYSIEGAAFTNARGTLKVGESIVVRHLANSRPLAYTKSTLRAGGVSGSFVSRTRK